jgi:hypothetical protein
VDTNVSEEPADSFHPENADSRFLRNSDKQQGITFTSNNLNLFSCLFKYARSNSGYIELSDWMTVNNELQRMWKEIVVT